MKASAIIKINKIHSLDPNQADYEGAKIPAELLYANQCTEWLFKLKPDASELEELAAKCQHFKRWEIPRSSYPTGKKGYYQWRIFLYDYQANEAAQVLLEAGYSNEAIETVKQMVAKKEVKKNKQSQLIEDVACLVFLEHYMQPFAATKKEYSEEKWLKIIRMTWEKMTPKAHKFALNIKFSPEIFQLINKALTE
jgi:hypothetical protein